MDDVNTQAAEQTFAWLYKYKHLTRIMGKWTTIFFIYRMTILYNKKKKKTHLREQNNTK